MIIINDITNYRNYATWKITIKDTITYNGVHLERGMSVDYITPTLDHPLYKTSHHEAVNQLFKNKYGVDLKKIGFINASRLDFEKK